MDKIRIDTRIKTVSFIALYRPLFLHRPSRWNNEESWFQSSFTIVLEQFQSSLGAISEQFSCGKSRNSNADWTELRIGAQQMLLSIFSWILLMISKVSRGFAAESAVVVVVYCRLTVVAVVFFRGSIKCFLVVNGY